MSPSSLVRACLIAVVGLLTLTACGGDDVTQESTLGSGAPDVEFLDGELPDALPSDLPIPPEAIIGTGMIDRTAGQVEAIVRIPAAVPATVEFFESNFDARGYTVALSQAEEVDRWTIAFEKDQATGSIGLSPAGDQITQAVIRLQQ